jgi:hypothetical protein
VNGSKKKEINIHKGFKQDDPLSHFFVVVGGGRFNWSNEEGGGSASV